MNSMCRKSSCKNFERLEMKNVIFILFILLLGGCETLITSSAEVDALIAQDKCGQATNFAKKNFHGDYLNLMLGNIQLNCLGNKNIAIEHYKLAARGGSNAAAEALIRLGEKPPEQTTRYVTTPASQPQQIIIQQQAPVMMPNPNACMQDGGSLFCPKHPSTR